MAKFSIVLVRPDIPGNTGSIGRTCVALDLRLILIKPLGFDLDEKSLRRAGLDYWKYVDLKVYENFQEYLTEENPKDLFFFSKTVSQNFYQANYTKDCHLIFGSETKGLPPEILTKYQSKTYSLPMYSKHIRSLNLSNTATAVAYEALRQLNFLTIP
ncbi:MAG: tRNA (uridine(34)/cytosine(34)/5-carboxymethylaminomethyluridine(34)-2'-O)-methyltransferase TrmL [Epsilonproteobacteria bacterium]|nr:MAG: tRNA (uridine(34)/cytosine(34)/5-carboxymethylaminomethyluridine(34)-2'-O)-methyltransferase TrmL [Campylobacterota bacterium]